MNIRIQRRFEEAFTLIELLMVIAIIGIVLAALLLPVLSHAKNHASKATDLNNLKQIMVAVHMYATDNQDHLPLPNWDAGGPLGDGNYHAGWLYLVDSNELGTPQEFNYNNGTIWSSLHDVKLYVCPMDGPNAPNFNHRPQQISSNAMNGAVTGYMPGGHNPQLPSVKLSSFLASDCAFWETDETHPEYFNDGANYPWEGVSGRHLAGGIQAAFDTSVSYIKTNIWHQDETQTNNKIASGVIRFSADGGDPDEPGHPQHD